MTNTSKSRAVHARVDACALATLLSYHTELGATFESLSRLVAFSVIDAATIVKNYSWVEEVTDPEQAHRILDEFVVSGGRERASQGIVKDALGKIEAGLGGE